MRFYIAISLLIPAAVVFVTLSHRHLPVHQSLRVLQTSSEVIDTSEPSYIQICRAIIDHPKDRVIVKENPSVCQNTESPYFSLLQIFSAALLADISSKHNLKIDYRHKCDKIPGITTVQGMLFGPIMVHTPENLEMSLDVVESLCQTCIWRHAHHENSSPECLLFPRKAMTGPNDDESLRRMHDRPLGMETLLPTIQNSLRHVSLKFYDGQRPDWELEGNYAVIYLSCKKEGKCVDNAVGDYRHVYAQVIPTHVTTIDIISSPSFANAHGDEIEALQGWMKTFYPETQEINVVTEPSTAALYSKIMKAKYLVCPPGLSCLLPALSVSQSHFSSIVKDFDLYPWLEVLPLASNVKLVDSYFKPSQCLKLQGREGSWVQDMNLAPSMQYKTPVEYIFGNRDRNFRPTAERPYRPATTYKWVENTFSQCPVNMVTRAKLCSVLKELHLTRIFFVGDSLTRLQAESLWKLLGHDDDPGLRPKSPARTNNWSHVITCPNDDFKFIISLARNDFLLDDGHVQCSANCFPWVARYTEFPGNTLVVANTGTHIHSVPLFKHAFDNFLNELDEIGRKDDLVFVRTIVPGHADCEKYDKPFENYSMYHSSLRFERKKNPYIMYDWYKFTKYNDYIVQVLEEQNRDQMKIKVEVLDIYPMTVLRSDGHRSDKDCLHYDMPGPLDWWNHLLYSHLISLAQ